MKKTIIFHSSVRMYFVLLLLICSILLSLSAKAQRLSFDYRRSISLAQNNWYEIVLPPDIYKNCNYALSDIRILGITKNNETIEAPFLIESRNSEPEYVNIEFKGINQSKRGSTYFYTFVVPSNDIFNTIQIKFDEDNYDRLIKLEGSDDQQTWFEFLNNYRVLSIHDDNISFTHKTIHIEPAQYKYLRVSFASNYKPGKLSISLAKEVADTEEYYQYNPVNYAYSNDEENQQTEFIVTLPEVVPVSTFIPKIITKNDYYRSYFLECATDSFLYNSTEWRYIYRNVSTGIISSLTENEMKFEATLTNRIRLTVKNFDNTPLSINSAEVKGNAIKIVVRIDKEADYFLYYGNSDLNPPRYDIVAFKHKIPQKPERLDVGKEEILTNKKIVISASKDNIIYIWIALGVIIMMMGLATVRMIKNYQNTH